MIYDNLASFHDGLYGIWIVYSFLHFSRCTDSRDNTTRNFSHLRYCVSSSTELVLLHVALNLLLRQPHLVSLAYDIRRQYSALVDGSHSDDQEHFLPTSALSGESTSNKKFTHVHHVVKHYKRCALGLLLVPYSNLAYTSIACKQVIQVLPGDLVIQVLDK